MPSIFLSASAPRALRKRAGYELVAEFYSICQMTAPPSWKPRCHGTAPRLGPSSQDCQAPARQVGG